MSETHLCVDSGDVDGAGDAVVGAVGGRVGRRHARMHVGHAALRAGSAVPHPVGSAVGVQAHVSGRR